MKSLKIFGYAWHTAHQHSLITAFPEHKFFYIKNVIKSWSVQSRPEPKNLFYVGSYEEGEYDLAILHLDQQCLFGDRKGTPYKMMNEQIQDIPKIVINHGSPFFASKEIDEIKYQMLKFIGDNLMIINSEQTGREWGFGKTIIHGLDGSVFKPARKKENRIIMTISPHIEPIEKDGWAEYYNREFYEKIKEEMNIIQIGKDVNCDNFESYKKYISKSLIYFNPTLHSPMPRARTEAMLAGCVTVSTPYHDWDKYIVDGKNGFLISGKDYQEAKLILDWLRRNPAKAEKIGQEGRKTALYYFNVERYRNDWIKVINEVMRTQIVGKEVKELKKEIQDLIYLIPGAKKNEHWNNLLDRALINFSRKIK